MVGIGIPLIVIGLVVASLADHRRDDRHIDAYVKASQSYAAELGREVRPADELARAYRRAMSVQLGMGVAAAVVGLGLCVAAYVTGS